MMVHVEQSAADSAASAMAAMTDCGISASIAKELALAVGAAAAKHTWSQPEIDFRLARTLHKLGHADAAKVMLHRAIPAGDVDDDAVLAAPPELLPLLRAGLLNASGDNVWRLDASALVRPDVAHELTYARLIDTIAGHLLPLWECSRGRGVLALAGWREHARLFDSNRSAVARCCRAWRRDLDETLCRRARSRGWTASPRVILAEPM